MLFIGDKVVVQDNAMRSIGTIPNNAALFNKAVGTVLSDVNNEGNVHVLWDTGVHNRDMPASRLSVVKHAPTSDPTLDHIYASMFRMMGTVLDEYKEMLEGGKRRRRRRTATVDE